MIIDVDIYIDIGVRGECHGVQCVDVQCVGVQCVQCVGVQCVQWV